MLVSVVYFPKILCCIPLKAKVASLGQTELENIFKITLFLNMKQRGLTGRTAKHYRTKLITAGECQGFTNVSTTSAIWFHCELFIFHLHRSLPLFLLPGLIPSHFPPLTLLMCTFSLLFLSLCLGFSLSRTHLASSIEFYLRGVTSPGKLGLSLEESGTTKQNNRDVSNMEYREK